MTTETGEGALALINQIRGTDIDIAVIDGTPKEEGQMIDPTEETALRTGTERIAAEARIVKEPLDTTKRYNLSLSN